MVEKLSEQQQVRLDKLSVLKDEGFSYPNDLGEITSSSLFREICLKEAELDVEKRKTFLLAGRLVAVRKMGKASFFQLQDSAGKCQVYIKRDEVGEESYNLFKSLDIGDLVSVKGYSFITKTGEPSLHANGFNLLVKSLHPLPEKWHGLSDVEIRYRQRYLDLIVNPDVKRVFVLRSKILSHIRNFFNERGYLEVETPVLSGISSGASARPFATHHNALDIDLNLRIALEIPLKKLLVGGFERVYEIGRVFRNEGISKEHNPEFTMIEFYQAYSKYEELMELTEDLICSLCKDVVGKEKIEFAEREINFSKPWKKISMLDSIHEVGEISKDFDLNTLEGVHKAAESVSLSHIANEQDYGIALFKLFDEHVESKLIDPTFITRHPLSVSPLARKCEDDERFCDRFELFVAGMELANAFNELNDPADQRERLESQMKLKASGDEEAMSLDEDFLKALEIGMPPTAGEGIGIDRLVMLLTGQSSIRDVILFPQMRPLSN